MIKTFITIDHDKRDNGVKLHPVAVSFEYTDCDDYCFNAALLSAAHYYCNHPELHETESPALKQIDPHGDRFKLMWHYLTEMPDSVCEQFGFRRLSADTVEFVPTEEILFDDPTEDLPDDLRICFCDDDCDACINEGFEGEWDDDDDIDDDMDDEMDDDDDDDDCDEDDKPLCIVVVDHRGRCRDCNNRRCCR